MSEWQTIGVTALPLGTATAYVGEYKTPRPVVALLHLRYVDDDDGEYVRHRVVAGYLDCGGEVLPVTDLKDNYVRITPSTRFIPAPAGLAVKYHETGSRGPRETFIPIAALRVEEDAESFITVTPMVMTGLGRLTEIERGGCGELSYAWSTS